MDEETFALRFTGGPWDGSTRQGQGTWPLPEIFEIIGEGKYRKTSESQLPPMPGIMRGAQYTWEATA